jgi:hypothetical protein
MVLVVETRSQNPRLVLQREKEPWKTKIIDDWEKEGAIAKDLQISDPINANTKIHNGSRPMEPTVNGGAIWITKK